MEKYNILFWFHTISSFLNPLFLYLMYTLYHSSTGLSIKKLHKLGNDFLCKFLQIFTWQQPTSCDIIFRRQMVSTKKGGRPHIRTPFRKGGFSNFVCFNVSEETRTPDSKIKSFVLYQLSYGHLKTTLFYKDFHFHLLCSLDVLQAT